MKIGAVAIVGVLLMLVGLPLYSLGDVTLGAFVAVSGLFLCLGAIIAAQRWAWSHEDDELR